MKRTEDSLRRVPEAAKFLAVSERTVWAWIARGRLKVVRMGRTTRISRAELDRFVEEHTEPATKDTTRGGTA